MTQTLNNTIPGVSTAQKLLHRYGLGILFSANVLGAGSVYILSQTGASVGFGLLWVLPLAFGLDMLMHDMSARMAADNRPLMEHIRSVTGPTLSAVFGLSMAAIMQLWAVANYAVAGAALSWFTGLNVYASVILVAAIGMTLVGTNTYNRVEAAISSLMLVVFVAYASLTFGLDPNVGEIAAGFNPLAGVNDATLIIAILGTTVYYPNFFIQSSIQPTKGWVDLDRYRKDNAAGIAVSILVSAGMLIVAAVALSPGELSLTDPAQPLLDLIGPWTLPVFVAAVLAASFTSATGTLFGSGFAAPQSLGYETVFGDIYFRTATVALIGVSSVLAVLALQFTQLTPVRMAIIMPALNGIIFLPVTIIAMLHATYDELDTAQLTATAIGCLVMLGGSLLTAQSLYGTIVGWL